MPAAGLAPGAYGSDARFNSARRTKNVGLPDSYAQQDRKRLEMPSLALCPLLLHWLVLHVASSTKPTSVGPVAQPQKTDGMPPHIINNERWCTKTIDAAA